MYRRRGSAEYAAIEHDELLSRADPIVIDDSDKTYVFFEEFKIERHRKGYLCVGELNANSGLLDNVKTILQKDIHLSYPLVFKHNDEWYLIPESRLERAILLYKFTAFPHEVTFIRTLIEEVDAVDTSVVEQDGHIFLFTNRSINGSNPNSDLSIFYSDNLLLGNFTEHPCSPITPAKGFGRMAGPIYTLEDRLMRPAQDCRLTYGRSIQHFEIVKLSVTEYEEQLVHTFMPPLGCMATHTYSRSKHYELIDVKTNAQSSRVVANNVMNLCVSLFNKIYK